MPIPDLDEVSQRLTFLEAQRASRSSSKDLHTGLAKKGTRMLSGTFEEHFEASTPQKNSLSPLKQQDLNTAIKELCTASTSVLADDEISNVLFLQGFDTSAREIRTIRRREDWKCDQFIDDKIKQNCQPNSDNDEATPFQHRQALAAPNSTADSKISETWIGCCRCFFKAVQTRQIWRCPPKRRIKCGYCGDPSRKHPCIPIPRSAQAQTQKVWRLLLLFLQQGRTDEIEQKLVKEFRVWKGKASLKQGRQRKRKASVSTISLSPSLPSSRSSSPSLSDPESTPEQTPAPSENHSPAHSRFEPTPDRCTSASEDSTSQFVASIPISKTPGFVSVNARPSYEESLLRSTGSAPIPQVSGRGSNSLNVGATGVRESTGVHEVTLADIAARIDETNSLLRELIRFLR